MIKGFDEYSSSSLDMAFGPARRNTAGVAISWEGKILLVHPTGASWRKSALGIPKGKIEEGEEPIDAAVRELREETGIIIAASDLNPSPDVIDIYKGNRLSHQLIYFYLNIKDPRQLGMIEDRVPKEQLQLHEIDWAGFVPIMKAYELIHREQLIILDRIS
jgi:8-oxo-dGTP pyrophosphatase MutT (NUDIX family)